MESVTVPRPHDLLRVDAHPSDAPAWVSDALRLTPWVVVRRAEVPDGLVAVGVRGSTRAQRFAWAISMDTVREIITPEALTSTTPTRDLPVFGAFRSVCSLLDGVCWGPTGSVGFELATGAPTATSHSDLDLLVREPSSATTALFSRLATLDVRVDCQVETRWGAVALAELVSEAGELLVRTPSGPILRPRAAVLV